jgi:hypothetical protein
VAQAPAIPTAQQAGIVRAFKAAWEAKDIDALIGLLDPGARAIADGGGLATTFLRPIEGGEQIARAWVEIANRAPSNMTFLERTVNGRPGLAAQQDGVTVTVFAFGIAGIYRKYQDFRFLDLTNWEASNYVARAYTAPASTCPASQGAQCPEVTYFEPTSPTPAAYVYRNATSDQYRRSYKGFELTARKRMSKGFMVNGSFSWNDTPVVTTLSSLTATGAEDPSNVANLSGGQYAPQTAGSGIDNIFINARWLARLSASYRLPWQDIGISGFFNARDGYPLPTGILTPSRANGAGTTTIYLAPLGDNRLGTFQNLDLRLDKPVKIHGSARVTLSADVFNVFNNNSIRFSTAPAMTTGERWWNSAAN